VAGFIGSNLLETLLKLNQRVVGLDNYATGYPRNLAQVRKLVAPAQWQRFKMMAGDIREYSSCQQACRGVDYVLHQAALGSVPLSIDKPLESHGVNVNGVVNMLVAAKETGVKRFVYASSSAVYGNHPGLPKLECQAGECLSPYATNKLVNELYAEVFARCYGVEAIGLRYFNVFGPRQDPNGAYAAVIPKWISALIKNAPVHIHGDGKTSRDFCYIANVVQANLLAATTANPKAINQAYNVAVQSRTSLNELFTFLQERLAPLYPHLARFKPVHGEFRQGDVRHSEAHIGKARRLLGYRPTHRIDQGLDEALEWYRNNLS
jgi:UDP-N-acetylglucosamine 4-epimerase